MCDIPLVHDSYPVLYCARNMDLGHEVDCITEEEESLDVYALTFWPSPFSSDTVVKQTSSLATYWHNGVKELRPSVSVNQNNETAWQILFGFTLTETGYRDRRSRQI